MNEDRAKFGRAFNAAVSTDWLITSDAFRLMLEAAARLNPGTPQAVDPKNEPDYRDGWDHPSDDKIIVRNGVAVIPITGPIFRYASLFTYFCNATSVDRLARNLTAALEDARVSSIMFEINSPGGEVTGINEFAQMVYRARSRKPISARVGGYGCSAAYWIASMCGDIVVDKTAQVGSIGVMAVYIDDRKALEMEGLSEIEFISSQSPYKNSPPYSDEGRRRIQKRIDALATVFVEAVAVGRGVTVKTVLENFGQGDVFVGRAAVEAGLADRLGSFEESISLLAAAHTPNYSAGESDYEPFPDPIPDDADSDEMSQEKTINDSIAVNSETVTDEPDAASDHTEENEEFMSEKKEDLGTDNTANDQEQAPAAGSEQPKADAAADQAGVTIPTTGVPDDVAAMRKQLEDQAKELASLKAAAEDKWLDETVAGFTASETAGAKTILSALVKAEGREGASVKAFIENQKAFAAQIDESKLFGEVGKRGAGTEAGSAEAKIEALAKKKAADEKITYEQAYRAVLEENKDLAKELA